MLTATQPHADVYHFLTCCLSSLGSASDAAMVAQLMVMRVPMCMNVRTCAVTPSPQPGCMRGGRNSGRSTCYVNHTVRAGLPHSNLLSAATRSALEASKCTAQNTQQQAASNLLQEPAPAAVSTLRYRTCIILTAGQRLCGAGAAARKKCSRGMSMGAAP